VLTRPVLLGSLAIALSGCGPLTAHVRGIAPLNPNEHGESTPVDVRFYQLRRSERFRAASVEQLWTAADAALTTDRVCDPVVASVLPGASEAEPSDVDLGRRRSGTEFVGVLALFRRGDARDARALVVPVDDLAGAVLDFSGCSVALAPAPASAVARNGVSSSKGAR
jgi:type VI secretion system VasD/TssJ family lipoprotein